MSQNINTSEDRLSHLESVIKKYQRDFYTTGKALREINDKRLYQKIEFDSFEKYIKCRWDMGKAYAHRLMAASRVFDNLSPIGDRLPKNEAQARPLTQLDPFTQRKVWREFLETQKPLSAINISKFVSAFMGKPKNGSKMKEIISKQYKDAVEEMIAQIRIAQNDGWVSTSKRTALYWNNVMKEKILWKIK